MNLIIVFKKKQYEIQMQGKSNEFKAGVPY
jgi:hypothetical protein